MPAAAPPPDPSRFNEAVTAFRRRVPMTDKLFQQLTIEEQAHAFTVAGVAQARVVQEVWDAVDQAVADGTTLEDFKRDISGQLAEAWGGEDATRTEMIFRTNLLQSYNEGRDAIFSHPEVRKARPYLRVDGTGDSRECPTCEPLNGTVLPADDPFWEKHKFPLHPGCRCIKTALSKDEADDEGISDGAPDHDPPADGFGTGADFEPDLGGFAAPIRAVLRDRLP